MPFRDRSYSSVVCFTMLHHVPSVALQDELFAEAFRVLQPGGMFIGTDSRSNVVFQLLHVNDTLLPVDPRTLPAPLDAAGFGEVRVDTQATKI